MLPYLSATEAAQLIHNSDIVALGGFTPAGAPKVVSKALAEHAERLHAEGKEFKIGIYSGASTGDSCDGALARAHAISFRTPYQANPSLREEMNTGRTNYFDLNLSSLACQLRYGFMPKPQVAIIEACSVSETGEIIPTAAVGNLPTFCRLADKIIIELNQKMPAAMRGLHDIYELQDPPHRKHIPIYEPSDRIGTDHIKVDPKKIVAVVLTDCHNEVKPFTPLNDTVRQIADNTALFLEKELREGRLPAEFLPIESGVGNIANAIMDALSNNPHIPSFSMYTEVIQDAIIDLIEKGKVRFASGCSLTISPEQMQKMINNIDFYKQHIVLRPQEISNSQEVVRRLGVIAINTAIEIDIYGNINSTHFYGTQMMNGLGGSGDFTQAAYLSIFTAPSTAKNGAISSIVPMVTHCDHTEHNVNIIITEQGVADLRGKSPRQRAELIINNCAHPDYRPILRDYLRQTELGQTPHNLSLAYKMHEEIKLSGDMHNCDYKI